MACHPRPGPTMRRVLVQGHFGEWMQGRLGPQGPVVLITLPAPTTGVAARHRPGKGQLHLRGAGPGQARALAFLRRLGLSLGGRVHLRPKAALGLGTGVSTAALVALARLAGWAGPPETLARACIATEGATDPLMFPVPEELLWASRQGRCLQALPPLPRHVVLGGFLGHATPTDPRDHDFPDIADLVADWSRAQSLGDFAALAAESAARCARHRHWQAQPSMAQLARDLGALGWVAAHTGAARGLIFAPGQMPDDAATALHRAGMRWVTVFDSGKAVAGQKRGFGASASCGSAAMRASGQ